MRNLSMFVLAAIVGSTWTLSLAVVEAAHHDDNDPSSSSSRSLLLGNDLVLPGIFGDDEGGVSGHLGSRCGRRHPCGAGLDCVSPTGIGWKICLPMTCIQQATDDFNNQKEENGGGTPFEDFMYNVMDGAGLSPTLFDGGHNRQAEEALFNKTTVEQGNLDHDLMDEDQVQHILKEDVRDALRDSFLEEDAVNPSMTPLNDAIQACFQPFANSNNNNNSTRRKLQDVNIPIFHGFFVEAAAALQFQYIWGRASDGNETITFQDFCFGAGPAAGAGIGYALQVIPVFTATADDPTSSVLPAAMQEMLLRQKQQQHSAADPKQDQCVIFPVPAFMVDVDAALGPGIGLGIHSCLALLIRLIFRFYVGAGGGLAFSICIVGISGIDDLDT